MTDYVVQRKTLEFVSPPNGPAHSGNIRLKTKNPEGVWAVEVEVVDGWIEVSIPEKHADMFATGTQFGTGSYNWTEYKQIVGKLVLGYERGTVLDTYGSGTENVVTLSAVTGHPVVPGKPPLPFDPFTNPNPQPGPPIEIEWKRAVPVSHGKFRWYLYLTEYDVPFDYPEEL